MSRFNKHIYIGREFNLSNFDKPIKVLDARQNKDPKYTSNPKYVKNGLPIEVMYENSNKYETSTFWCNYDSLKDKRGDKVRNFLKLNKHGCYHGVPKYKSTKQLDMCWRHMWERCNDLTRLSYRNVHVCDEWRSYQKFLDWVYSEDSNYLENEEQDLDKDLLQFGVEDKIYSPSTCIFIPSILNTYLSGVSKRRSSKFQSLYFKGEMLYIPRKYVTDMSSKYIRYVFFENILERYRLNKKLNHKAFRALHTYNIEVNDVNINLINKYVNKDILERIDNFLNRIFKK